MTDELCDVQNDQYSRQQLEKDKLVSQLGRREVNSASEKLEHDILQSYGQILRARLQDPDWLLFDRHRHEGELYAADIDEDGCLIVDFIVKRRFEPARHARFVKAEFIGADLVVRRQWDFDRQKE